MRISSDINDPGYATFIAIPAKFRGGIEILFNGMSINDVLTADEEKGEIAVFNRDMETGRVYSIDDTLALVTHKGRVKVLLPHKASDGGYSYKTK